MRIGLHFEVPVTLRQRKNLKKFIASIFERENRFYEALNIIFCSDDYLLGINRTHLHHDYYTDIITFDLSDSQQTRGEIYISIDRVRENAGIFKASFDRELLRVIFHGVLHLCGFKDKNPREISIMRKKENFYISAYLNVPRET